MEPFQTHDAPLPQQALTRPAGGCPPRLRPEDLMREEHEGANPHAGQQVAFCEVVDSATTSTLQPPGVFVNTRGNDCVTVSSDASIKVLTRLDAFKLFKGSARDLPPAERIRIVSDYFGPNYHLARSNEEFKGVLAAFLSKSYDLLKRCRGNEPYLKKNMLIGFVALLLVLSLT